MTEPDSRWRTRARAALNRYFQERSSTRLIITLILIVTGSVGFIISVLLLHGGMTQMWIRYPVSVFTASYRREGTLAWTAIRKTILQACMFALLLSLAGWCLEFLAPGSHSIGPAIHQLLNG